MVWVLFIAIASPGVFSGTWGTPVEVGEYSSLGECKSAWEAAVSTYRDAGWRKFDDGAICLPRTMRSRP